MSTIDPRLQQVLDEHGEGVHVIGNLAERAIERDRSNRRRELGVAALGAGLVLAVALPVAWSAGRPTAERPTPAGTSQSTSLPTSLPTTGPTTAQQTPTTTPTPAAIPTIRSTGAPDAALLRPATGPVTGATEVGFVVAGTYQEGRRRTNLPAPFRQPDQVASLGDGLLLTAGGRAIVVDAGGQTVRDLPALAGPIAVAADRSHALVTDQAGNLLYLGVTGQEVGRLPAAKGGELGWQAAGLVGSTAYASNGAGTSSVAWDVASDRTTTIEGAINIVDTAGARAIVTTPSVAPRQSGYGCQRLVDLTAGRTNWNLCGPLQFTSFSADGSHLLGFGFSDGQPPELNQGPDGKPVYPQFVVVRTDDARVVLQGGGDGSQATGAVHSARFGPDGSITAQITAAGQQRDLQHCTLDGRCEVVGGPGPSWVPDIPEAAGPYLLAVN